MKGYLTVGRERESIIWKGTVHGSWQRFDDEDQWITYIKLQIGSDTTPYTLTDIYGVYKTPGNGITWDKIPSYSVFSLTSKETTERLRLHWKNVPLLVGCDLPFFCITASVLFGCVDCSGDLLCRDEAFSLQVKLDMFNGLEGQLPGLHKKLQNKKKRRQGLKNDT